MSDMIDPDERDLAERTAAGCECRVNDSDACIAGTVYVPCDNEYALTFAKVRGLVTVDYDSATVEVPHV